MLFVPRNEGKEIIIISMRFRPEHVPMARLLLTNLNAYLDCKTYDFWIYRENGESPLALFQRDSWGLGYARRGRFDYLKHIRAKW
jgi:hypothetical protein